MGLMSPFRALYGMVTDAGKEIKDATDPTKSGAAKEFQSVDPQGDIAGWSLASGITSNEAEKNYLARTQDMGGVADQLRRQMMGENSLSAEQLRQGLQQNLAAQRSAAAGARPSNAAMAARNAAIQMGRIGSGASGQQAMAGIAERNAAAGQLGGLLGQMRGQDIQYGLGSRGQALQGFGDIERARTARYGAALGVPTFGQQAMGAAAGLGTALAMSDKRAKKDIEPGEPDVDEFLKSLRAYRYRYKNPANGKGPQLGVMAQDLEKSVAGRQAVVNTPQGKMVHGAKLAGALAAAMASVDQRLRKVESK